MRRVASPNRKSRPERGCRRNPRIPERDGAIRTQLERIEPVTGEPDQARKAETEADSQDQTARLTDAVRRGNIWHPRILLRGPGDAKPLLPSRPTQAHRFIANWKTAVLGWGNVSRQSQRQSADHPPKKTARRSGCYFTVAAAAAVPYGYMAPPSMSISSVSASLRNTFSNPSEDSRSII